MISHDQRCIFVHIPKTAGNSVNRVFGIGWQDHKDLQRYHDQLPPEVFADYFKFAIVRNPWDRLLSDYNYQLKKSRPKDSKLFVFAANGTARGFAEWVETALSAAHVYGASQWGGEVSPHIHRWSPQVDWLSVDGRLAVDFVARLEHLGPDFRTVCLRVGLPPTRLPHRNRRLHWHYSRYYDRATRELVAAYYERDIAEFGYEFEDALLRFSFAWPFRDAAAAPADAERPAETERTTVHFASPRRTSWLRRLPLAFAAGFTVLLGAWATAPASASAEMVAMPRDSAGLHRVVVQGLLRPAPRRPAETPFTKFVHWLRGTARYHVVIAPTATSTMAVVVLVDEDDQRPVVQRTPRVRSFRAPRMIEDIDDRPPPPSQTTTSPRLASLLRRQ